MGRDRRTSYRLAIAGARARIDTNLGSFEATLADLSADGGSLILPAARDISAATLRLQTPGHPTVRLSMSPVRLVPAAGHVVAGVRFDHPDTDTLRVLSQILIERIGEAAPRRPTGASIGDFQRRRVRQVLRFHVLAGQQPLHVYRGDLVLPLLLRGRELAVESARQLLLADVLDGDASLLDAGELYDFAFATHRAVSTFRSQIYERTGQSVVILLPPAIRQAGFRQSRRFASGGALHLSAPHPRLAGTWLTKPLLDFGGGGFSFAVRPEVDVLFPGESLADVRLVGPRGEIQLEAVLRGVSERPDTALAGRLEIVNFGGAEDRTRWQQTVLEAAYQGVELGDEAALESIWGVLESSGYLAETTPALHESLAKNFFVSWRTHVSDPELARVLVIRRDDRPVATVAANLVYPGTWMVHHLAIDETERELDRRRVFELAEQAYCGMQLLLSSSPRLGHFIAYADAHKGWHQMVIGDFLQRYSQTDDYVFDPITVYKCTPENLQAPTHLGDLEAVAPTPALLKTLAEHFAAHLHETERGAYGLAGPDLELREFSRWCSTRNYERERRILFALEGGTPVAALVAEFGDQGVNIFSLLNTCWLVHLRPAGTLEDRVKSFLLRHALRMYFERGKRELVLFGDEAGEPEAVVQPLGFRFVAHGFRFVARGALLPAWMNHVDEIMRMMRG